MADDRLESHPAEIVFVGNCAKLRLNEIAIRQMRVLARSEHIRRLLPSRGGGEEGSRPT